MSSGDEHDDSEWRLRRRSSRERRRRSPAETIVAGGACAVVFGALLVTRSGEWWWVFPAVFCGLMPLAQGVRRLILREGTAGRAAKVPARDAEKEILRAAQGLQGRITAPQAALNTSLSIKEAQEMLERMTKEGHAVMNVTPDGIIEFQFPEFLPRTGSGSP